MQNKETSVFDRIRRKKIIPESIENNNDKKTITQNPIINIKKIIPELIENNNDKTTKTEEININKKEELNSQKTFISNVEEPKSKFPWWWFLLFLLLFLLLLFLLYFFFGKGNNETTPEKTNSGGINTSNNDLINGNNGVNNTKNKGIVSEENIGNYKNNPNNDIESIGDINNDGKNDYVVNSPETIKDSIAENIIIPIPKEPNIDCLNQKYTQDWYKINIGYTKKVEDYLEKSQTGAIVSIAVVDSGISKHKDLLNSVSKEDFANNIDNNGHGTNIAGIIFAINPKAKIIPIKISDDKEIDSINILKGLKQAIDKKPDIINLSFGAQNKTSFEENLIKEAQKKGIIVIASAGNDSKNVFGYFPASYSGVLNIGSSSFENNLSSFSNFGTGINFLAPGECIYTTDKNNNYTFVNGTSFSSPMMAGIISLYIQQNKENKNNLLNQLTKTSINQNGYKIPNVEKFLSLDTIGETGNTGNVLKDGNTGTINNEKTLSGLVCEESEYWKKKYLDLFKLKKDETIKKLNIFLKESNKFNNGLDGKNVKERFQKLEKLYQELELLNTIKVLKYSDEIFNIKELNNLIISFDNLFGNKNAIISISQNKLLESVGIKVNTDDFYVLIKEKQEIPANGNATFKTRTKLQRTMFFDVYQGKNKIATKNNYLGKLTLEGLIPIQEMGPRVKVNLTVNKNGKLNIEAFDIINKNNKIKATLQSKADFITQNLSNITKIKKAVQSTNNDIKKLIIKLNSF